MNDERTRLILTRKLGQSIWIGDSKITLDKNVKKQFRLIIEAKSDVRVERDEIRSKSA